MTQKTRIAGPKKSLARQMIDDLNEFADALEKGENLEERFNCHTVMLDLRPSAYDAKRVKQTRELLGASQVVFARFLGVSANTVRSWEQDVNTPQDVACRFMDEIRRNPTYWRKRIQESFKIKSKAKRVVGRS